MCVVCVLFFCMILHCIPEERYLHKLYKKNLECTWPNQFNLFAYVDDDDIVIIIAVIVLVSLLWCFFLLIFGWTQFFSSLFFIISGFHIYYIYESTLLFIQLIRLLLRSTHVEHKSRFFFSIYVEHNQLKRMNGKAVV